MFPDDDPHCEDACRKEGRKKGGELVMDESVCPFQYFCKCRCNSCADECKLQGKVHVNLDLKDKHGCDICNCQCEELNCWKTCNGDNFIVENGTKYTFYCPECKCICPDVNCDEKCSGKGSGITKKDVKGCIVCDGCKIMFENDSKYKLH